MTIAQRTAVIPWHQRSQGAVTVMLPSFTVSASPPTHVKVAASQRRIEKQAQAAGSKKK